MTSTKAKCKICRRLGTKLFLKGEKCFSPKCPMVRKPYPPGKRKKRRTSMSEYNRELREKQKLRNWYNLREAQFKNYVKEVLKKRGRGKEEQGKDAPTLLIQKLESRLDNIVFRMGFADSRSQARQLVSHGHILVNKRKVNIPSFEVKKGDKISVAESSKKKKIFQEIATKLKKKQIPSWLKVDVQKLEGEVKSLPTLEEVAPPVEISMIFEFYSR
ncbi:30S ribosomal protein S4 [bacterium]|nr:30S ribosomal protein S4 [bacterium]